MTVHDDSGRSPTENAPASTEETQPKRRRFLTRLSIGLSGLAGVLIGLPVIGFIIASVRRVVPDVWRPVGAVDDFAVGRTVKVAVMDPDPLPWAGFSARTAAYVRRLDRETVIAFSIYCTHTGCPVEWIEGARLFFCPCHGGAFHHDGAVAAGPPPRALPRHDARIRNGQVEVRTRPAPLPPPGA